MFNIEKVHKLPFRFKQHQLSNLFAKVEEVFIYIYEQFIFFCNNFESNFT